MNFRSTALFILLVGCTAANATVITFESLAQNNGNGNDDGRTYTEGGFMFTEAAGDAFNFTSWGTQATYYDGSTALYNNTVGGTTFLNQVGGGAFNMTSINLDQLIGTGGATVTFIGTHPNLTTVTQSFTIDGTLGQQTFNFTGFTNLQTVSWLQVSPFHQFDNVNVSAVPEPASMAALGLGAVALLRRRRK